MSAIHANVPVAVKIGSKKLRAEFCGARESVIAFEALGDTAQMDRVFAK